MEGQRAEKAKGGVGGRIPCVPRKAVVALLWAPWQQGMPQDSLKTLVFISQIRLKNKGKEGAFFRNQDTPQIIKKKKKITSSLEKSRSLPPLQL